MSPKIFIFMGRSGCGKGTQAKRLIETLKEKDASSDVLYVSTGEEFRKIIAANNYTSAKAREIVDSGKFGPAFLASMLWSNILTREYKQGQHIMIDGSPRTIPEAKVLGTTFGFYGVEPIVIYVNVSVLWASARLTKRGRNDDTPEGIASRMNLFGKEIMPIIEMYKKENKIPMIEINGEQAIDPVHEEIKKALGI